jgi:hypothetical protein
MITIYSCQMTQTGISLADVLSGFSGLGLVVADMDGYGSSHAHNGCNGGRRNRNFRPREGMCEDSVKGVKIWSE